MIDLSERPMYPEIGNCDLFSDARRKTCYERGKISMAQRCMVTPSIIGRMLVDEKAGEKTWNLPGGEQNIYILYSEISGLCCVPLSLGFICAKL